MHQYMEHGPGIILKFSLHHESKTRFSKTQSRYLCVNVCGVLENFFYLKPIQNQCTRAHVSYDE